MKARRKCVYSVRITGHEHEREMMYFSPQYRSEYPQIYTNITGELRQSSLIS